MAELKAKLIFDKRNSAKQADRFIGEYVIINLMRKMGNSETGRSIRLCMSEFQSKPHFAMSAVNEYLPTFTICFGAPNITDIPISPRNDPKGEHKYECNKGTKSEDGAPPLAPPNCAKYKNTKDSDERRNYPETKRKFYIGSWHHIINNSTKPEVS